MFLAKVLDGTPDPIRAALSDLSSPLHETTELRDKISQVAGYLDRNSRYAGRSIHFLGCGVDFENFCKPMIDKARQEGAAVSFSCMWARVMPSFYPEDDNTTDIYRAFHGKRQQHEPEVNEAVLALSIATDRSMVHSLLSEISKRFPKASVQLVTGIVSDRVVDLLDQHWDEVTLKAIEYGPDMQSMRDPYWNVVRILDDEVRPLATLHPAMQFIAFTETMEPRSTQDTPSRSPRGLRPPGQSDDDT